MKAKKILSILTATIIFSSFIQISSIVNAEKTENVIETYGTGGLWENLSDCDGNNNEEFSDAILSNPPSSFDITTNTYTASYFPPIGNQGTINSCTGWSTTYYQFTFEANKLKGTPTTSNNTYSPSWTYNYINGGENVGVSVNSAYTVLANQGAMYLTDYPHDISNYSFTWSSNLPKMREALSYRAIKDTLDVSSYNLSGISSVKSLIATGKVAVIWTNNRGWDIEDNSLNGDKVIVRSKSVVYNNQGHYMAVVGYDDNYQITVEGKTLTGAFKLANSWGTSWGNSGYIWVSYDALLYTSDYGTTWQSNYSGTRFPVFGDPNQFSFIDVYECKAYFTETLQFTSYYPWSISVYGKNGTGSAVSDTYLKKASKSGVDGLDNPDTRYLVFDYTNPGDTFDVGSNLSTSWTLNMTGRTTHFTTYNIGAKLTDNLGNEIEPFNNVYYAMNNGNYSQNHISNIARGRVTSYDNNDITLNDASAVQDYLLGLVSFSSLQEYLADYNDDGSVDMGDVVAMINHIGRTIGVSSIYDILPGCDYSIADYIENRLGMSVNDFLSISQSDNEYLQ